MRERRRIPLSVLVLVAAAALLPFPAAGQGVIDTEVLVGVSSAFLGPSASLGSELYRGYMAYFNKVNAAGGVAGRKIRVIAYDDSYDPEKAVKAAIKLVENDKVFILFGEVGTPTLTKVLPLLLKYKDIPIYAFAPFTGAQPQREDPYLPYCINIRASYRQEAEELVRLFTGMGKKEIAVFYQNDSYGRSGYDGVERALKSRHLAIAAETNYPRGAQFSGSMAEQVEVIKNSGADAVICVGAYQACAAFVRDARKAGVKVPIANVSFVGSEALLDLLLDQEKRDGRSYTDDLYNSEVVPPFDDDPIPLVAQYRKDMEAFAAQLPAGLKDPNYRPDPFSFGSLEGYVDAVVFVKALEKAGKGLTPQSFMAAIQGMKGVDIGVGAPITFGPGDNQGMDKVYLVKASTGKWSPVK